MILSVVNYGLSLENTEHNGKNGGNKLFLSKELMENVGTIFNIVLSSANKGEKYEVGVWLDKILPSSKK